MTVASIAHLRRQRRWSALAAFGGTVAVIASYFSHSPRAVVVVYAIGAVPAWGLFIVSARALRAAARSSAG